MSISTIAKDVIGAMDQLQIAKAVVVGHSMGGLVVTELGSKYPDRIAGVVAIGPTHPNEGMVGVMTKRAETVLKGRYLALPLLTCLFTGWDELTRDWLIDGMEPMANTIPNQATGSKATPLQKAFIRELLLGQNPKGYAALCKAIAAAQPGEYAAVQAPFLLIAGQEDKSASMEGCEFIFNHVGCHNKRMEVLAKVGHWHCIEDGDVVGKLMADFMGIVYGV